MEELARLTSGERITGATLEAAGGTAGQCGTVQAGFNSTKVIFC